MARSWIKWPAFVMLAGVGLGTLSVGVTGASPLGGAAQSAVVWKIQPSRNRVGATASSLDGVSCRPSGACMAVGTYFEGPNSAQATLAERRIGTKWSVEPTPPISGIDYSLLSGVSCAGPKTCVAVGYTATSRTNTVVRALAEAWNGSIWTIDPTPLPKGAIWVSFAAVSCPSIDDCIAVGGYIKNGNASEEQPLAEQWNGSSWSVLSAPNPNAENGSSFTSESTA